MRHKHSTLVFSTIFLTVQSKPELHEVGKQFRISPSYESENGAMIIWKFTPSCSNQNDPNCIPQTERRIARRQDKYQWVIEDQEFEDILSQDDSNDLVLNNPTLKSSGNYKLEVLPANSQTWEWGPEEVEMFKRPDSPIEIIKSENYQDNNEHAIASPGRKQNVATCIATGAKPAARLQWQWEGDSGSEVLTSDQRNRESGNNGEQTTELDLNLIVTPSMNKKVFTCVATQPGIPTDSVERVAIFNMQVKYSPQRLKLELITSPSDSSIRKVRCSADANPKPRFNFTLPNGTRQPPRAQSPEANFYETIYDEMNSGTYECSACNKIDRDQSCSTVRKTSSELLSNGGGEQFLINGLPLWVWIVIVCGVLIAGGIAVVFCACKPSDGRKSRGYKQGGVSKADISRPMNLPPDGQSSHYDSMNSRHKLIPTRKASDGEDGNSFQGATIVQTAQDAIGNDEHHSDIHDHIRFLQQNNKNQQETQQYLNKSREILNDDQMETNGLPAGVSDANELHRNNNYDGGYTGTAYFDQPPPQPVVTAADLQQAQIRNQFPRASGNSHASNRPYSQHFGYGGAGSSGVNTNTLPNNPSQRSNDYGSQFGYGSSANAAAVPVPSARSMGNLAGQEQYAETTLI